MVRGDKFDLVGVRKREVNSAGPEALDGVETEGQTFALFVCAAVLRILSVLSYIVKEGKSRIESQESENTMRITQSVTI